MRVGALLDGRANAPEIKYTLIPLPILAGLYERAKFTNSAQLARRSSSPWLVSPQPNATLKIDSVISCVARSTDFYLGIVEAQQDTPAIGQCLFSKMVCSRRCER